VHVRGFDADEAAIGSQSHRGDNADEADTGFDQSVCEQKILSERVSAVAIADVETRSAGGDRFAGAAQVSRGGGFAILRIQLAESAVLRNEDEGFGRFVGLLVGGQQQRQVEQSRDLCASHADGPCVQQPPSSGNLLWRIGWQG